MGAPEARQPIRAPPYTASARAVNSTAASSRVEWRSPSLSAAPAREKNARLTFGRIAWRLPTKSSRAVSVLHTTTATH